MKKRFSIRFRKFLPCKATSLPSPSHASTVDVREEYANAFRTQSYLEFWTRVLDLTKGNIVKRKSVESTTAARLPSYRLFAQDLLDPDQPTVARVLARPKTRLLYRSLLADYFSETADASLLCGRLLKDVDKARVRYRALQGSLESVGTAPVTRSPAFDTRLTEFTSSSNPFVKSASSYLRLRAVQSGCSKLLKRLESSRNEVQSKLGLITAIRGGSAICLVVLTASVAVIVAFHAFAMLVAGPGIIMASLELASVRGLKKASAQLDAASKGTYILNRDLDTISRLVARLNDELEHVRAMVKFWLEHREYRLQDSRELARRLKMNNSSFSQQLDDLEEHLYLCFMTINRARKLVIKEILDPGQPTRDPGPSLK